MKRPGKSLDVKTIDALKPRGSIYRITDGGGLLLEVRPTGAKIWVCRLTVDGRRRDMGLGGYPVVTLAAARGAATAARQAARSGVDPIAARDADKAARVAAIAAEKAAAEAGPRTFKAVAEACIAGQAPGWKSKRTVDLWRASLASHAHPTLGDMPIAEIDRAAVMRAIEDVWTTRPATARKVLRRIGSILRYAAAHGWRLNDNPADPRMLRHLGLPSLPGGRKLPSLAWAKAPAFLVALDTMDGFGPLALRFAVLTAMRSNEVRGARWSEVSFDGAPAWTVPGERMKQKKASTVQPHRVPLSGAAIDTLARAYSLLAGKPVTAAELPKLAALRGNSLIFPSSNLTKPLSDMTLSACIRRLNEARPEGAPPPWRDADGREAVPHGFRATFRTWVDDTMPGEAEAAERALAHEDRNVVSGAYRRSDLFDRRIGLMEAWATHCAAPSASGQPIRTLARESA
ncbi:tyrosine-type recombinase/integrase [Plastoroseomonas arctica]|uniref:Integrase arm-type DNA-binding domain-containing protein n=1 Tax=Plastoroseomonas arctica TaxID=1509237 RepID=A0AAF1KKK9_9PROT|nr:integrase arm-type DNA-binding domain-containing protein [Plastoroseomonas arctica]MBR0653666.1 integrase arm-type DNA-binding domain-containing protein [Plastoroseomonas arctica]